MKKPWIKSIGLLGYFFLALASSNAFAEGHSAGLMVGQLWPSGEIGKDVDSAVAPGIFYEYAASDVFSLYAEGVRSRHSDDDLKLFTSTLGMKAHLVYFDKLAPYALLGAGLYFTDKRFGTERGKKTNFGIHLGLGAELDLSEMFFMGLEFDVHNIFAGNTTLPSGSKREISGRWAGFFLRGGVRF